MTELNLLAVQNASTLRALIPQAAECSIADLARSLDRDASNLSKTLKALNDAGLATLKPRGLTEEGRAQLAAIDRAEGAGSTDGLPSDHVIVVHAQLIPDPDNARKDWDSDQAVADLAELADSIAESGLLQNPMVRRAPDDLQTPDGPTTYILDGGERRWRALARLIEDGRWPVDRPILCRLIETDDLGHRLAALAENLQRRNLNPLEKARAFEGLADALTASGVEATRINREIADRIGVTIEHIQQHRSFLKLDHADQTRLTLPKDDPRRLTVSEARQKLSRAAEREAAWKPTSHPAAEQLILAEMTYAARQRSTWLGSTFPVAADARQAPLPITLAAENLIILKTTPVEWGPDAGHFCAGFVGWQISDACRAAWPALCDDDADKRRAALQALQVDLSGSAPQDDQVFLTPWLNPPFALTEEGQAIVDRNRADEQKRVAQQAALQAEREKANARYAEARTRHLALLNAAAEAPPTDTAPATTAAAADVDHPLPWTLCDDGAIVDAAGEEVTSLSGWGDADDRELALGQIIVVSVNTAAGLPTPPIRPADEEAEAAEATEAGTDPDAEAADDDDQPDLPLDHEAA